MAALVVHCNVLHVTVVHVHTAKQYRRQLLPEPETDPHPILWWFEGALITIENRFKRRFHFCNTNRHNGIRTVST